MVMPTDEEIGQAVLEAARYGDLDDLKELHQNYGRPHFDHKGAGDNTALHYGECIMVSSVTVVRALCNVRWTLLADPSLVDS